MSITEDNQDKPKQGDRVNARINTALKGIRFGSVVLTIHDSRIVQIERIEKKDHMFFPDILIKGKFLNEISAIYYCNSFKKWGFFTNQN